MSDRHPLGTPAVVSGCTRQSRYPKSVAAQAKTGTDRHCCERRSDDRAYATFSRDFFVTMAEKGADSVVGLACNRLIESLALSNAIGRRLDGFFVLHP
jgi:hypothetical protein